MTKICPRCGSVHSLQPDGDSLYCCLCGWRPEGTDPGYGPEAQSQLLHVRGSERHTKGAATA